MLTLHVCLAVKEVLSSDKRLTNEETRMNGVISVPFGHQKVLDRKNTFNYQCTLLKKITDLYLVTR